MAATSDSTVKTIVLVHGGFVDGSGWEEVHKILKKDGYNVSIVQNPTISLADDVAVATGWALPSMTAEEALEEIATESASLKVARVEFDHNPNLGLWYGIRRIPTILCFVGGEERIGMFGVATKEAILSQLTPIIAPRAPT